MNFERGIHDLFYSNILCYPLGNTSEAFFDKIVTSLNTQASRFSFSQNPDKNFKEKAKNSVPKKDWNYVVMRCRYRVPDLQLDWEEGRIRTKCNAGIIIADMKTYDAKNIDHDIAMIRGMMEDNHIGAFRIFLYNYMQEQINFRDEGLNQLVSVMDQGQNSAQTQQREVEKLLTATAMNVFEVMETLKNESHKINVFGVKEDGFGEKMKKIKKGRSYKLMGDLALMLGCSGDAVDYYAAGYERLESNKDYLWMGKIHEAQAACLFLDYLSYGDAKGGKVIDMIMQKMESYESSLKKVPAEKSRVLQNERILKVLRMLKYFGHTAKFCSVIENIKREDYLPEEYFKMMLKVAEFFYDMKMFKKAGFFIKQAGDAVLQENLNPVLARNIYLTCLPIYNLPLPKKSLPESFPKNEFFKVLEANSVIGSEVKRVDPILQLQLINEILANSPADLPLQAHLISIVLRYFIDDIDAVIQQRFFNHLIVLGGMLNNNMKLDLSLLPELIRVEPISEVLKVNIKQHEGGVDKAGVFIYNPWKRGANSIDYNWMSENLCYVKVFLRNPFDFEVCLDSINLVTEGVKTISYPTSAILRKTKALQEVTLKFKPLETGTMNLLGIVSKLSNFVHFHPINAKGVAIKNYSERTTSKDFIGIKKIPIKEKISTLKVFFEETAEEIKLYEGGRFCTRVMIENKNESTVCLRKLQVSFAFTDNTTLDREVNVVDKQINRYEQLPLMIYRKTSEDERLIQEELRIRPHISLNVFDVPNVDKMFKIYVKLIYYQQDKPNISIEDNLTKEVKMTKSLSVWDVKISNSLATDQITVSGKSYHHVSLDDCFYLNIDVHRDDPDSNKNDYAVSVYLKGVEQPLKEQIILGSLSTMKLTARVDRQLLSGCEDLTKRLYGKWKDLNSIDTGYLSFSNVDNLSVCEQFKGADLNINMNTGLSLINGQHEVGLGELKAYKMKICKGNNIANKLYISVAFSEDVGAEQVLLIKKEKGVVYKGKKSFLVEFEEGKKEAEIEIKAIFTEERNYNLFCFSVDEESSVVYSYKYPFYFKVK